VGLILVAARWASLVAAYGLTALAALGPPDAWLPPRSLLLAAASSAAAALPVGTAATVLAWAAATARAVARAAEAFRAPAALWEAHSSSSSRGGPAALASSERFTLLRALTTLGQATSAAAQIAAAATAAVGMYALPLAALRWRALGPLPAGLAAAAVAAEVAAAAGGAEAVAAAADFPARAAAFCAVWCASGDTFLRVAWGGLPCQDAAEDTWDLLLLLVPKTSWAVNAVPWAGQAAVIAYFLGIKAAAPLAVGYGVVHAAHALGERVWQPRFVAQQRAAADATLLAALQRTTAAAAATSPGVSVSLGSLHVSRVW
jgi:hypothetical protein